MHISLFRLHKHASTSLQADAATVAADLISTRMHSTSQFTHALSTFPLSPPGPMDNRLSTLSLFLFQLSGGPVVVTHKIALARANCPRPSPLEQRPVSSRSINVHESRVRIDAAIHTSTQTNAHAFISHPPNTKTRARWTHPSTLAYSQPRRWCCV